MLLEGLKRLEYRGYDSAGVAIMNGKGVETRRAAGKISRLEAAIAKMWNTETAQAACGGSPWAATLGDSKAARAPAPGWSLSSSVAKAASKCCLAESMGAILRAGRVAAGDASLKCVYL